MGLFKRFRFTDDMNVQFRAEFFNVLNRVNFDIPEHDAGRQSDGCERRELQPDHSY